MVYAPLYMHQPTQKRSGNKLTLFIVIAMAGGVILGYFLNGAMAGKDAAYIDQALDPFMMLADIFLRLIKMIVAPLVFTTLVAGVARQGNVGTIGRIGGKSLLWFFSMSFVSLFLGMALVNFFKPGETMHLTATTVNTGLQSGLSLRDFMNHIFPTSIIDAMARNEILQVVVFAILFGIAAAALGEKAKPVVDFMDIAAHIILKMPTYIMNFAPFAVFGAITHVIAKQGLGILGTYGKLIGEFYLALVLLLLILLVCLYTVIRSRTPALLRHIKEPFLIAFSTSSSEAAFPKLMLELERFGCNTNIVSFVLPLGYSFNLAGSMLYMTFASLFIAQAYGIHLDTGTQLSMLLTLMLTSKGIAGVPRSSLVVVAGTLATFKLPEAGMALLLGIDPIFDMGRASMNVIGNSVATVVINKWELGELEKTDHPLL